jgi:3-deoxy-manno-octulosonate cytidylyltransferase (CMP-KDO synthetase)
MQVMITSPACLTGTDRVAEVAANVEADYYINVQGDEPLINPRDITSVIEATQQFPGEVINGYCRIDSDSLYYSLSIPKVVFRPDGRLLYMSRSPIPGNKKAVFEKSWRQVCVYAFPKKSLLDFSSRIKKTSLEEVEDIEILRFLEMGYEVRMIPLSADSVSVDTPDDVGRVLQILNAK